jgi:hypothetical protein
MHDTAVIDDQLKLKLTIASDENPDLFLALRDIKDPRRRTRRLKDLAVKGLLSERAPAPMRAEMVVSGPAAPSLAAAGGSVSSMLDWEDNATL